MSDCSHHHFGLERCPVCGDRRKGRTVLDRTVGKNLFLLTLGLLVFSIARASYSLVKAELVLWLAAGIFALPFLFHFFRATRGNPLWLSKTPMRAGLGLALLGGAIIANGAFDRSTTFAKPCAVVRKYINTQGRLSGNAHYLVVQCDFMARTNDIFVDPDVYRGTPVGNTISLQFHRGLFGAGWYGRSPVH